MKRAPVTQFMRSDPPVANPDTLLSDFVAGLDLPEDAKTELLALTPSSYTGNAAAQAKAID